MNTVNAELPGMQGDIERPRAFVATPERVSQYLELKTDEVTAQMRSVEGRQELFNRLMEHEEDLRTDHADFHPDALRGQLDAAGETLLAHERYLEDVQVPEKKTLLRRAWDTVKAFPKNHPVVTALLAASAVAGSIAAGFYFTGNWELLMATTGLNTIFESAEAATEFIPSTAPTDLMSNGGVVDIVNPASPPGSAVIDKTF